MPDVREGFVRLGRDYYLDVHDIGELICVIIDSGRYNILTIYENCLLIDVTYDNKKIRPKSMLLLYNNSIKEVLMTNFSEIQIKFLN